ncbi:MAG: hypothetical protein AAFY26_25925 [Cyanobacteria bacterium J06638_22]
MAPQMAQNEVRLTLSDKAMEEFQLVADWLNIPLATMIRQHIEEYHRSPSFKSLVTRARDEIAQKQNPQR